VVRPGDVVVAAVVHALKVCSESVYSRHTVIIQSAYGQRTVNVQSACCSGR
jgi:hypothetical protein